METRLCFVLTLLLQQIAGGGGHDGGGHDGCVPGFQVRNYQLVLSGPMQKGQPLLQVEFDDCAGNEDVSFEVSDSSFHVDGDLNLVPRRDVETCGPLLLLHGFGSRADDRAQVDVSGLPVRAQVDVSGLPVRAENTLPEVLGLGQKLPSRSKRALLVPPMVVTENQRPPFPRLIGKSHVILTEKPVHHIFRLTGPGADQHPKGLFTIDMDTGDVSVSRSLDREASDSYQLEVSTTDFSGNVVEGPVILVVTVIDQNDNRPVFKESRYTGEVLEGSPTGTTVMTMTAFDADDPNTDNAVLRYHIVRQSPDKPAPTMFYIDADRGDIVTVISPSLLDRETLPTTTYELEIVAKDMAGSEVGLTGTATATITITDQNDHSPEFTHPLFEARVPEGSRGVVVNLTVDDRDDPTSAAWRASYSVISGDPRHNFQVQTNPDNNEGMLAVVQPLDYETTPFHTLLIRVENEEPLLPGVGYGPSATATVHVTVEDVNEGPVFVPDPLLVTRMENVPVGSVVATLSAADPDALESQSIRYAVLSDPAAWLSVNPVRGTVSTSASLDRESPYVQANKYTALFVATDNGWPPATGTGTLVLQLQDYNDNAPFLVPSVAQVCQDAGDRNVAVVAGRDRDAAPNAAPFKIELGKQPGLDKTWRVTRINSTHSQIQLLQSLKKSNYQLPLLITDSGSPPLSNSTEVKVQVCICTKTKRYCSSAYSHRTGLVVLLSTLLLVHQCP